MGKGEEIMKYKEWLEKWQLIYVKPYVKERTYQKYKTQVKLHIAPRLGEYEMENLTAIRLQEFILSLTEKGLAANTINGIVTVIKISLKKAVSIEIINKQYTDCIQRPKARAKQVQCFSLKEQRKMEMYIIQKNQSNLFGVILCFYTGLRIGELLALRWSDVDFQKGFLRITKSCYDTWKDGQYVKKVETPKTLSSERIIPLPKSVLSILKSLKRNTAEEYIISGKRVHGISVRSYQKTFERLLKRLEISHKSFHSLRHTFATRALECGMDVKTLSEILGHKNPTVTLNRYAHSMFEHKKEMMNKVGKLLKME